MDYSICQTEHREPWNKGKLVGQKAPLKLKEIWAIRVRLQLASWKARFGTWASRSTMLWKWPSKRRCSWDCRGVPVGGAAKAVADRPEVVSRPRPSVLPRAMGWTPPHPITASSAKLELCITSCWNKEGSI